MIRLAALAVAFAVSTAAHADMPSPLALQAAMVGSWTGALGYRDYQTDKLSELAVKTDIRVVPDGATVIRTSAFDDGPKAGIVYITSATLYDAKAGTVTTTTLRKGRAVDSATDRVATTRYVDPSHWTVIYERDGEDDDKPAKIRTTETRDGDAVLSVKDVMPAGTTVWRFRNQTRLTKAAN